MQSDSTSKDSTRDRSCLRRGYLTHHLPRRVTGAHPPLARRWPSILADGTRPPTGVPCIPRARPPDAFARYVLQPGVPSPSYPPTGTYLRVPPAPRESSWCEGAPSWLAGRFWRGRGVGGSRRTSGRLERAGWRGGWRWGARYRAAGEGGCAALSCARTPIALSRTKAKRARSSKDDGDERTREPMGREAD